MKSTEKIITHNDLDREYNTDYPHRNIPFLEFDLRELKQLVESKLNQGKCRYIELFGFNFFNKIYLLSVPREDVLVYLPDDELDDSVGE